MRIEKVLPALDDATFAKALLPILKEYLEHGDTTEVKVSDYCYMTGMTECS